MSKQGKYKITMTPVKRGDRSSNAMIMQIAGSTCDDGFVWDPLTSSCVPDVPSDPNRINLPKYNNTGDPTNFNEGAYANAKGNVISSDVIPTIGIVGNDGNTKGLWFDSFAGMKDSRGTFIPQQQVIGDALDKGFNMDSDGKYRKLNFKTDPNHLDYNPFFQTLNLGLDAVRGVAGAIGSSNLEAREKRKLEEARIKSRYGFNPYENGLNQLNIYSQNGGSTNKNIDLMRNKKYQVAGQVPTQPDPQQMQQMAQQGPVPTGNGDQGSQPQDKNAQVKQLVMQVANELQSGMSKADIIKALIKIGFNKDQAKALVDFVVKNLKEAKENEPNDNSQEEGQEDQSSQPMQDGGGQDPSQAPQDTNQGGGQDQQIQQIIQQVAQALQQGQSPEDIVKSLVQAGIPQEQAQQIVQQVMQSMNGGGQGGQQPQQAPQQGDMPTAQKGGYLQCPPRVDMGYSSGEGTNVGNFLRGINPFKKNPDNQPDPYYNNPNYMQDRVQFILNNGNLDHGQFPVHSLNPTRTSPGGQQFYEAGFPNVKNGGKIEINPDHKGLFTKEAKAAGMSVAEFAKHVLANKDKYSAAVVKRANFAHNFAHQTGGNVNNTGYTPGTQSYNNSFNIIPSSQITMANTPFPVMAYPENGSPTLMMPGSNHNFGDSKYVTEVPMANGGKHYSDKEIAAGMLKHKLSAAAKKHFEYVLAGKIQMHGHTKDAKAKGTYQMGGEDTLVPQEGSDPNGNAILERGEVFTNPSNNNIEQVAQSEPTHDGSSAVTSAPGSAPGNDGSIQQADRVLENTSALRHDDTSKLLKVSKEAAYALTGFKPKSSISHAKLYKEAVDNYKNKVDIIQKAIDLSLQSAKDGNGGIFAKNSLNHNVSLLSSIPTAADLFDKLYEHQEAVKQMYGVTQDSNQPQGQHGGKYLPIAQNGDGVSTYPGGVTQAGRIMPDGNPNPFSFNGGWDAYKKIWSDNGLDLSMFKTNEEVQGAVYDYMLQTHPEVIREMWKHGNTAHGLGLPNAYPKTFSDDFLSSVDNLRKLKSSYVDGWLGARTLVPYKGTAPVAPSVDNRPAVNTPFAKPDAIKASTFSAPLKWYDVFGDAANLADSYNLDSVPFEQLKRDPIQAHLLNPQPTLDENIGAAHAIQDQLPTNGAGAANQISLGANLYKANNNVLGQYADKNQQILDNVDRYNDQTQGQLDVNNLNLRMKAYEQMLATREAAREQRAASTAGLMNKIATNAALNVNGNLAMKLFPHFNQNIEFNGNPYQLLLGPDGAPMLFNKQTGEKYTMVTKRDADGQVKGTTQIVKGNR